MDSLLTYIVQVNILLSVLCAGYYALLKSLTFYKINRLYFLLGGAFSVIYPFLDIRSWFQRHADPVGELVDFLPVLTPREEVSHPWTMATIIYLVIAVGAVFLLGKLFTQLFSLLRIHLHSVEDSWKTYIYRNVLFPIVPFSFFNRIYLNKEQHQEPELYDIFEHEDIHVKGLHTIDVLFFELLLSVCWYNPLVWLTRRAVRQNLEFLTDQQVLKKGVNKQAYQYSLLHVSKRGAAVGVSNQFNFKLLKKRIMMMNKKRSSTLELSKYAFMLPVVIFAAGAFTVSKADGKISEVVELVNDIGLDNFKKKSDDHLKNINEYAVSLPTIVDTIKPNQDDTGAISLGDLQRRLRSKEIKENPMVIIDGDLQVIGKHALRNLKVDDIESMRITRDSNAVERFGSKAADGVIEITTKSKERLAAMRGGTGWRYKILESKSEIDQNRDFLYVYDGKAISKEDFFKLDNSALHNIVQITGDKRDLEAELLKKYPNNPDYLDKEGWVKASSKDKHAKQQKNVLYVIDGKVQEKGYNINKLAPDDIKSVAVWKGKEASKKFGSGAIDGAVEVTLKESDRRTATMDTILEEFAQKDKYAIREQVIKVVGLGVRDTSKNARLQLRNRFNSEDILVISDGKEVGKKGLQKMSPDNIESITVLKDSSAVALYGKKAKAGVILITTKKENADDLKEVVVVGRKAEASNFEAHYSDDDTFFVDGKPVSKNEFKAMPEEKIEVTISKGGKDRKGKRREILTKK